MKKFLPSFGGRLSRLEFLIGQVILFGVSLVSSIITLTFGATFPKLCIIVALVLGLAAIFYGITLTHRRLRDIIGEKRDILLAWGILIVSYIFVIPPLLLYFIPTNFFSKKCR